MKQYYVYILASKKKGTLYVGVTNNLLKRVYQHKTKLVEGFTKKYKVDKLVYFEETTDIRSAIEREKTLKRWKRNWKLNLIKQMNPEWNNLFYEFVSEEDIKLDSCLRRNDKRAGLTS
jgi:putative endonuclease